MTTTPTTELVTYIQPEIVEAIREQSAEIVAGWTVQAITTAEEYQFLAEYVKRGKQEIATIEDRLRKPTKLANEAHKSLTALAREMIDPIKEKIAAADREALRWWQEQERVRLAKEAEGRRLEQERQQREEKERQEEIERLRKIEIGKAETEQLAAAEKAGDLGMPEVAEEILSQPVTVDPEAVAVKPINPPKPTVVEKSVPKIQGRSYRKGRWVFEIMDESLIPRQYLMVNESAIRSVVNGLQSGAKIPGVRVYQDDPTAVTRVR